MLVFGFFQYYHIKGIAEVLPSHPVLVHPSHHSLLGEAAVLEPFWDLTKVCDPCPCRTPAPPQHLLGLFLFQLGPM